MLHSFVSSNVSHLVVLIEIVAMKNLQSFKIAVNVHLLKMESWVRADDMRWRASVVHVFSLCVLRRKQTFVILFYPDELWILQSKSLLFFSTTFYWQENHFQIFKKTWFLFYLFLLTGDAQSLCLNIVFCQQINFIYERFCRIMAPIWYRIGENSMNNVFRCFFNCLIDPNITPPIFKNIFIDRSVDIFIKNQTQLIKINSTIVATYAPDADPSLWIAPPPAWPARSAAELRVRALRHHNVVTGRWGDIASCSSWKEEA